MAAGYRRPDAGFVRGGVEAEEVVAPHFSFSATASSAGTVRT